MKEFGIFEKFWNGHPNHLPFLYLTQTKDNSIEWNLEINLNLVNNILKNRAIDSIIEGLKLLLQNDNWRPHLLALISILQLRTDIRNKFVGLLWHRLGKSSWVSPQILVVLSVIDKQFTTTANEVLLNGLNRTITKMDSVGKYIESCLYGPNVTEKKIIAAIQYLLTGKVKVSNDNDRGGEISKEWKTNLEYLVVTRKIVIP